VAGFAKKDHTCRPTGVGWQPLMATGLRKISVVASIADFHGAKLRNIAG
jgi:hypothetical protein